MADLCTEQKKFLKKFIGRPQASPRPFPYDSSLPPLGKSAIVGTAKGPTCARNKKVFPEKTKWVPHTGLHIDFEFLARLSPIAIGHSRPAGSEIQNMSTGRPVYGTHFVLGKNKSSDQRLSLNGSQHALLYRIQPLDQ
jgi:hypothetical protein